MRRVSIYGLKRDRKSILEALQRRGVVEITDTEITDYAAVKPDTAAAQATFTKGMSAAESALDILSSFVPEKTSLLSMFEGKKDLSVKNYYTFISETDEIMRIAMRINALSKEIAESKAEIIRNQTQLETLTPWLTLDVPLSYKGTKKGSRIYRHFSGGAYS
jgi:V/A-type H+-transporting ATPase subunit I